MKLSEIRKFSQMLPRPGTDVSEEETEALLHHIGLDPGTFYQELEMDSPYVDTHRDISYSNSNVQFHSHAFYEVLCCNNACGTEYLVGTERYKLQKGDIIFVPPGISHRPLLPKEMSEPYIRDVLWISTEFIKNLIPTIPEISTMDHTTPYLIRSTGTHWEYICQLFHKGVTEAETAQIGWQAMVAANTINILVSLIRASRDYNAKPLMAEKPELMDQVLTFVEDHLAEKITLAEIVRHFFVSESTITQTFRKKMGISFYRYVTQRRLIASKNMIESGIPLEAVSEKVGFSDYSSFFRAFKQEYGIGPRQYRRIQNT